MPMADEKQTDQYAATDAELEGLDDLLDEDQDEKADGRTGADPGLPPETEAAPNPDKPSLDPFAGTEVLLNNLIAECHFAMREVAIPAALKTKDALTAQRF